MRRACWRSSSPRDVVNSIDEDRVRLRQREGSMRIRPALPSKRNLRLLSCAAGVLVSTVPVAAQVEMVGNPLCPGEEVRFNPGNGEDIVVPPGFRVSRFASGLNFPTGLAFRRTGGTFEVYVLESGHGLPSRCKDQTAFGSRDFDPTSPFTPDSLVFNQTGGKIRRSHCQ